jgi:PAS domain S-box-containing protein
MDDRRLKILLIEDDEDDFIEFRDLLSEESSLKFHLEWVSSYEAAREQFTPPRHDVYILDYRLGHRDGLELLEELARIGSPVPVILLTGMEDYAVDTMAMKLGAMDYLVKGQITGSVIERSIRYAVERKRVEEALRKSEEKYRELVENANSIIMRLDTEGKITFFNEYAEAFFGYPQDQLMGRNVVGTIVPDVDTLGHPMAPIFEDLLRDPGHYANYETEALRHTGERAWIVWTNRAIFDQRGDLSGILSVGTDVTEKKALERALLQHEKLASLGLLVSSIAHEINNPNSFISFNIPILREYLRASLPVLDNHARSNPGLRLFHMSYEEFREDMLRILDNMEHGSNRITAIVTNLKSSVRKGERPELQRTDIRKLIHQTVSLCQPAIGKKIKDLEIIVAEDLGEVTTDPGAIQHVVTNLLLNAADACDKEDSHVVVRVWNEAASDRLVIEVSDNGIGIDERTRCKIFDPFFTTKERFKGTGLGLYLCHNLVEGLGGRMEVDTVPGRGSTFRAIFYGAPKPSPKKPGGLSTAPHK